ncbi:MAG: PAS domain S-box protein [Pedobacter sp.]|nr:MAG: PAS domain S-box protein [Pedobacter sp.]
MEIRAQTILQWWTNYKRYVANNLTNGQDTAQPSVNNWQDNLFISLVIYIIPFSILAVISCIAVETRMGHYVISGFDMFTIITLVILMLNRRISLGIKKLILLVIAVAFSLVSAIIFGYYVVGAIYLFGVGIFVAYQFSTVYAYLGLLSNLLIWTIIGLCLYYHITWFPASITIEKYIIFISNLSFLNLIMVIIIRQTLVNLDRSILEESILHNRLQKELAEVAQLNVKLRESEAHYKALFFLSPLPKWIYDIKSRKIIQVNKAAVTAFGYSEDELLTMNISKLTNGNRQNSSYSNARQATSAAIYRQLIKKNGEACYVEINWTSILFEGKSSRIVIACDITDRINYLEEIEHQNTKLKEIAFMQTHVVRSPLTKIMALSDLIRAEYHQFQEEPLFINLNKSANELDQVIHKIIKHGEKPSAT